MIHLIEREHILQYEPLASFIAMIQSHQIDGEFDFISSNEEREELKRIYDIANRYETKWDSNDNLKERVFYHPEDNLSLYPSISSNSLCRFFGDDDVHSFFVLPHLKLSLISEEGSSVSFLQDAQQLLYQVTNDRKYDEAYKVDEPSFDEVIQALFWLVRYDATIPEYVFMCPESKNYFISPSKHGSLYFYILEENESEVVSKVKSVGLKEWDQREFERFSDSSAIEGRFTKP